MKTLFFPFTCRNISPSAKMLALDRDTIGLNKGIEILLKCIYTNYYSSFDYNESLIIKEEQVC